MASVDAPSNTRYSSSQRPERKTACESTDSTVSSMYRAAFLHTVTMLNLAIATRRLSREAGHDPLELRFPVGQHLFSAALAHAFDITE